MMKTEELRAGMRVRATLPNGSAVEGDLEAGFNFASEPVLYVAGLRIAAWPEEQRVYLEGATFEVLSRPKPAEPQGIGAVVRDTNGDLWVRADNDDAPWYGVGGHYWDTWDFVDALEVVSEGVQL